MNPDVETLEHLEQLRRNPECEHIGGPGRSEDYWRGYYDGVEDSARCQAKLRERSAAAAQMVMGKDK